MSAARWRSFPLSRRDVVAFVGPFGSGKTEVAVSYARAAAVQGRRACLVDLDVVTPYFRAGDYRERLRREGVRVVAPAGALASYETPAVPPEVAGALAEGGLHVVLDVGGDPVGARLLGAYAGTMRRRGCEVWLVVNPFRPFSGTPEAIADHALALEEQAGLAVTALVANPNLGGDTRPADVRRGLETVKAAARARGLTVLFLALEESLAGAVGPAEVPVLPLRLVCRAPWQQA